MMAPVIEGLPVKPVRPRTGRSVRAVRDWEGEDAQDLLAEARAAIAASGELARADLEEAPDGRVFLVVDMTRSTDVVSLARNFEAAERARRPWCLGIDMREDAQGAIWAVSQAGGPGSSRQISGLRPDELAWAVSDIYDAADEHLHRRVELVSALPAERRARKAAGKNPLLEVVADSEGRTWAVCAAGGKIERRNLTGCTLSESLRVVRAMP